MRWNASTIGRRQRPIGTLAASGLYRLREQSLWRRENRWNRAIDTPSTIGTLALWLDGSDRGTLYDATTSGSLVANGGAVARWEDKSGNARHAAQSTANNRPILQAYGDAGGLLFDGTNDNLTGAFPTLSAQTIFIAALLSWRNATNMRFFTQRNTNQVDFSQAGHYIPMYNGGNSGQIGSFANGAGRLFTDVAANTLVFAAIHDGSNLKLRFNGVDTATYAHTMNGTFAEYSIGANFGGDYFRCLVFEVAVFTTALSSGDLTKMDDYFKLKYNWAF